MEVIYHKLKEVLILIEQEKKFHHEDEKQVENLKKKLGEKDEQLAKQEAKIKKLSSELEKVHTQLDASQNHQRHLEKELNELKMFCLVNDETWDVRVKEMQQEIFELKNHIKLLGSLVEFHDDDDSGLDNSGSSKFEESCNVIHENNEADDCHAIAVLTGSSKKNKVPKKPRNIKVRYRKVLSYGF